ncbi:sensor histidine kinase [Spirosoma soli]|uniref:Sensor histidine kinase n=1 Tax=Spirosoma soli TaxID=1770529 RepID=A0ABW5M5C8_9BACT
MLDSLIDENPTQARVFLEELSTVYRYLLRANEQNLTDLTSELSFIRSYFHLLKIRYGSGVNMVVAVDERHGMYQIPPLTLQLLVENAAKHNVVLPEQPLSIRIQTGDHQQVVIRNNLQRKKTRVISNQVGLANIAMQYRLLNRGEMRVEEDENYFTVTLPLL